MNPNIPFRAAALGLAAVITGSLLVGLDRLATQQHAAGSLAAGAAASMSSVACAAVERAVRPAPASSTSRVPA